MIRNDYTVNAISTQRAQLQCIQKLYILVEISYHVIPDYNKLSEVEHSVELNNYIMLTRGICQKCRFRAKLSAPVGPIEISNKTENSVDIEWKPPEHNGEASIKDYSIEYSTDDTATWTKVGKVDGTTHNFSLKGLPEGEYFFKVTATNSKGLTSELKSEDQVELIAKLSAPVGPIEISNITENSVDIEWKSPEHNGGALIEDYSIEYSTDDTATWTKVGTVDGTTHNFSLKGLQEGEYYFKVTATNSKGLTSELKSEDLGYSDITHMYILSFFYYYQIRYDQKLSQSGHVITVEDYARQWAKREKKD
ncbi:hypothetical protein AM593_01703, partial [Mytilus galloprovincialis]